MRAVMRSFGLLGLILAGIAANAQNLHEIKVNVPFNFTAAGKDLPPGEYHLFYNPFNAVVAMRGENSTAVYMMSAPSNPTQDGRSFLRFYRYGQHQVLQDVSIAGAVRRLPSGHAKKPLTAESAQPNEKSLGAVTTPALVTLLPEGEEN
jgi:hypothetical protein